MDVVSVHSSTSSHDFPLAAKSTHDMQQQQGFTSRIPPPASCPLPGGMQLSLGLPMNSNNSDITNLRSSPFAHQNINLTSHYSQARQNLEQQQKAFQMQQQQQTSPTSPLNASLWSQQQANTQLLNAGQHALGNLTEQQQLANASRQRQQLVIPSSVAAPRPLSLNNVPPLLTSPDELAMLEPHLSHNPPPGPISPPLMKDAASSALDDPARVYRRTVSSPTAWDKPLISTGHNPHQPIIGSTGSVNTHPAVSTAPPPPPPHQPSDMRISHAGMPVTSPAISATTGPSSGGKPDPSALNELAHPTSGTATVVKAMLAELPPALQPVVLAKVATKGRGGRQPAPDPRSADPNIDPRKARRILANRQSAARSKLKQRVLLETLRVGKEVMVAQQGSVHEELNRLRELVRDLETRNKELEHKIQMMAGHQTSTGGLQVQPAPHLALPGNAAGATGAACGEPSRGLQQPASMPNLGTDVFSDPHVHGWWDDEDQAMDTI